MLTADTALRYVQGVGPRRAEALAAAGLTTVEDLLYVLPFRYEDRRSFAAVADLGRRDAPATVQVTVKRSRLIRTRRRGFTIFEAWLEDDSGAIRAVWYNQPFLQRVFTAGRRVAVYGRAGPDRHGREIILASPEYEVLDPDDAPGIHAGRIVPVYRKTAGLAGRALRRLIHQVLEALPEAAVADPVPPEVALRHQLMPRHAALHGAHFPAADADPAGLEARRTPEFTRLAFEEIFVLQLALALRRRGYRREARGIAYRVPDALRQRLGRLLPFRLTEAQKRVLREIRSDLESPHPMNRLLQGDVGSGKTIVAFLSMLVAVENGYQAALMAPTEILAEQHHRTLQAILAAGGAEYRVACLTGSRRAADRRAILAGVEAGVTQVVVGTHALFERGVRFARLGLAVVDEQHRFGVLQRAALAGKGARPDVLVMSATPIPRSLALTAYGDLDLSVLDARPPGRRPVRTMVRGEADRERVYRGVRAAVSAGRQAYVVVPLVEETAASDLKAATAFARDLAAGALAGIPVGLVHGRMRPEAKDAVMRDFAAGAVGVLVATTVVEVGVDVPNATVMVVEHAERFGLSQLHQLRGRVGRSRFRSYCVLLVGGDAPGEAARRRLEILEHTDDGFLVAERDLEIRGPGAVFGTQQHGLSDLQFLARILRDPALLDAARAEAWAIVEAGEAGAARAQAMLDGLRGPWRRRLRLAGVV